MSEMNVKKRFSVGQYENLRDDLAFLDQDNTLNGGRLSGGETERV